MRQTRLGTFTVGTIAYGCWRFAGSTPAEAREKIETALDAGMTLIDTADIYGFGQPCGFGGAEAVLGDVIAADKSLRERMVIATKGGIIPPRPYDSSYSYLIGAAEASLRRLRIEQIDLYQIHRPDLTTPVEETARALNALVASGKVKHVGVSNFTVAQTRALQAHLDTALVSTQPEFSAVCQDSITDGTLDWCSETAAACLAWSPLGGGRLADGGARNAQEERVSATLNAMADKYSVSTAVTALAFVLKHQANIIPIIGTQTPARIREAAAAAQLEISARDFYDIIEAWRGVPMP
ncbi:MAG: aldo/keto reductase [Hyphomonas sp.]|uniref:aldo/keto reductase n=1 Tax=Hyphomonas sp. TaxID=87 RepID=UPI003527A045